MCIPMHVTVGVSPYSCCVEANKIAGPQEISSLNILVSIADHSHTILAWGSQGITLKIAVKIHYVNYNTG